MGFLRLFFFSYCETCCVSVSQRLHENSRLGDAGYTGSCGVHGQCEDTSRVADLNLNLN